MNKKYVIAKFTNSGFGDHLSCVFGAWWYAKSTNRILVIDWRGSRFNPIPGKNCFFSFFKQVTSLAGVPIIAGDEVADMQFLAPYYPDKWISGNIHKIQHVSHTSSEMRDINTMIEKGISHDGATVIINQHIHPIPPKAEMRLLLGDLEFSDVIKETADKFTKKYLGDAPVIGMHIRHGNGENIGARASYWLDAVSFTRQLMLNKQHNIHRRSPDGGPAKGAFHDNTAPSLTQQSKVSRAERNLYKKVASYVNNLHQEPDFSQASVFLCTDAVRVESGVRENLDNVYTYPKRMICEGSGPLHQMKLNQSNSNLGEDTLMPLETEIVMDMLIELELLRRCKALVCIPSQFSVISRQLLPENRIYSLKPPLSNRIIARLIK
jgi:hypothetical protein